MKLIVTGGAGFIGSNFVHRTLAAAQRLELLVVDKLTYAGNLKNIESALGSGRCEFAQMDICEPPWLSMLRNCDAVVHFAAESHVDRSIEDAAAFVRTNIDGTYNLIQASRRPRVPRFIHVSTDEVYGSLDTGEFTENRHCSPTVHMPRARRHPICWCWRMSERIISPPIITRCSNNYGPYQFPEKFIPLMIAQAAEGKRLPVYGKGANVRDWIHVSDHCDAIEVVLQNGRCGEVYNIGGRVRNA